MSSATGARGRPSGAAPREAALVAALYGLEGAAAVLAVALYKYWGRFAHLAPRQWAWLVAAAAAFAACAAGVGRWQRAARRAGTGRFGLVLATNAVAVAGILAGGELLVRALSVPTPAGLSVAGTVLLPRRWEEVRARNAAVLRRTPAAAAYLVSDTLLGWTVGPSRRSADGRYLSSAEGLRSARAGQRFAADATRPRIALVGDSYTFGLEVPFEDTWGVRLERELGGRAAVLNFGVDGYGVDQAYLRYRRDVRPWRPAIAILGFINHDLYRSLSVYSFITFPAWGFPFGKPRFVLRGDGLALLNVPVPAPEALLAAPSAAALPFIAYDPGYVPEQWEWRLGDGSRLLRFVASRFPRWPAATPPGRDGLVALNSALTLAFARQARADGTVPIVAYFPSRSDFAGQDRSSAMAVLARLGAAGVTAVDLTGCVARLGVDVAFLPGRPHYSPAGNAAVARCLGPLVRRALRR